VVSSSIFFRWTFLLVKESLSWSKQQLESCKDFDPQLQTSSVSWECKLSESGSHQGTTHFSKVRHLLIFSQRSLYRGKVIWWVST
jgi:hypothetical protein